MNTSYIQQPDGCDWPTGSWDGSLSSASGEKQSFDEESLHWHRTTLNIADISLVGNRPHPLSFTVGCFGQDALHGMLGEVILTLALNVEARTA